ncbi:MAG: hypothetical protein AAFV53_39180 [Myxococcota bacterium]
MVVLLFLSAAFAACPELTFTFHGQPACVDLAFEGARTRLTNRCDSPLIIDQQVLLDAADAVVLPQADVEIRDLSAFTLGVEGTVYAVFARVETCAPEADTGL